MKSELKDSKRRVLLVSAYPFSQTSRGIDVLTEAFEREGWDVEHLNFPRTFYTPKIPAPPDIKFRLLQSSLTWLPYIDRFMWWLPRCLFEIIRLINIRSLGNIVNLSSYDFVVLESGKPLFLLPEIPGTVKMIYRQSDSVNLVLGRGRWYRELENAAFRISSLIILKKDIYRNYVPKNSLKRTVIVENGMTFPDEMVAKNPFRKGSLNAIYVGLHPLDMKTLLLLLKRLKNVDFHIIGPCLNVFQRQILRKFSNFFYEKFLAKEIYFPMLKHSDVAIFPFIRTEKMKWFGLTSKFLHFMYFKLPIVSYYTGLPGEFGKLPVKFVKDRFDFIDKVADSIMEKPVTYTVDFDYYSLRMRMNEYRKVVRELRRFDGEAATC